MLAVSREVLFAAWAIEVKSLSLFLTATRHVLTLFVECVICQKAGVEKSKGISRGQEKGTLVFFSHLADHIHSSLLVTTQHMLARLY